MNESTEVGRDGSSLLRAVHLCRLRLTRLLLEGGAYINESNEQGETPLMVACKTQHVDAQSVPKQKMVRYLLENGADPNIQDKMGKTALIHACVEQSGPEILTLLLTSGADPTLEDHTGLSALVYAVNSGNREILRVLLDACKAKGKEVIIITTNKALPDQHMTKQNLSVPPPADLSQHHPPCCCSTSYNTQPQTPAQALSAAAPQTKPPCPSFKGSLSLDFSPAQPSSPKKHPRPVWASEVDKHLHLHRLQTEQRFKIPSLLFQQNQVSSLKEEPVENAPEGKCSTRTKGLGSQGRHTIVSRHHSIDVKDAAGFLNALENLSGNESTQGGEGGGGFGRKMSYDSAAGSLHSVSHPNLHQDSLPFPHNSTPEDEDSSDCLRQMNISSLQNVVHRRSIGFDHYSSDSQLLQFGNGEKKVMSSGGAGFGQERYKTIRPSTLSGSKESLESSIRRRNNAALERRGSGALVLDHIAHKRPGYLPPLNPHAPIPDIGVNSSVSCAVSGWSGDVTGSNSVLPCVSLFPQDLKAKKMLWRRHSMQSEQIKQLSNFKETF